MPMRSCFFLLLLILALPAAPAAAAQRVAAVTGITLEQAVAQVRRDTGGRILAAETMQENGRRVHRIKVLTPDNSVRVLSIGAGGAR